MKKNILVFDSGIGGLSILSALQTLMPEHNYSYLADNGACPYGEKSDAFLQARIITLFENALAAWPADVAVIACNTASTLLLEQLRNYFKIDFVGVVPAIKPAAAISQSKHIALLATKATTSREYVKKLQDDFAGDCQVSYFACPELVAIAEQKLLQQQPAQNAVSQVIKKFSQQAHFSSIDTVILGCTHFAFLKDEIKQAWPTTIQLLDSSEAVAKRCKFIISQQSQPPKPDLRPLLMLTSTHNMEAMTGCLTSFKITAQQLLTWQNEQNIMSIGAFAKK